MTVPKIATSWANGTPQLQSLLRILAAIVFILAGSMKLFALPAGVPPNGGTVPLWSQAGVGGVLEVFGGGALLLGLFTKPVAFILSGEMANGGFLAGRSTHVLQA